MGKERIKKIGIILTLFLVASLFFVSCKSSGINKIKNNLSEITQNLFASETPSYFVTLTSGQREEPYKRDGISNQRVDFAVICLTFFENCLEDSFPFKIKINDVEYNGNLEKNLLRFNYMCDLQIQINSSDEIVFTFEDSSLNLTNISEGFETNVDNAIEIAAEHFKEKIEELVVNGRFKGEVFLKIINNPLQNKGVYFWHFSLVGENGSVNSAIVDTMSNQLLASY